MTDQAMIKQTARTPKYSLSKTYDFQNGTATPKLTAIFLHGIASDSNSFKDTLDFFLTQENLSGIRFIAFDLLGHGKSPKTKDLEITFEEQLAALESAIATAAVNTPIVLVGHSMGTFIATRFAKEHPEVKATILVSPPLFRPEDFKDPRFKLALEGFRQVVAAKNRFVSELDEQIFENELQNLVLNSENYQFLSKITIPTTLIYGDHDRIINISNLPKLLRENAIIETARTPGGHSITPEKTLKIAKILEEIATSKLELYNTLTRKIETFKPVGPVVKIYTCGPTVYSFAHIGNFTSYIYWDLLVRTLKENGFKIKRVLNLTDVGHLTSDGDEGEDKLEKGAAREGKSVFEIADFYAQDFLKHYKELNLTPPDVLARATDYIEQDIQAVTEMTKNGFTYETKDGIYFDTSKFPEYANLARLDLKGLKAGARVDFSVEKKNPTDFAVWKFIQPGEKHAMRWDYLNRPGYPGWHLECSTIIHQELGEPIDIHTGGIDHIPVHHTNEIAQTYALSGLELAHFWLHCNFITIDGEKISKSLGNVFLFSDLAERGFSPLDFKMWVLSGHYQGTRNFTFDSLEAAKARRLNWRNKIARLYQESAAIKSDNRENFENLDSENLEKPNNKSAVSNSENRGDSAISLSPESKKPNNKTIVSNSENFTKILKAVNHNLNSPEAFAIIDNSDLGLADWQKIDRLFGLNLIQDAQNITPEIQELIDKRQTAREEKDYEKADQYRDKLAQFNIGVKDTQDGPVWEYLK